MLTLDHLAVACTDLAEGAGWIEDRLGVAMQGGGKHPLMGTHNRLLGLGDLYLEAIAIDPTAPAPARPRWFDLDRFAGPPRLTKWIARCDDLAAELALGPAGIGRPVDLARGDYRWRMAVPDDGILPFDDAFPALIEWQGAAHPARALTDHGIRLTAVEITHPQAGALAAALAGRIDEPRLSVRQGAAVAMAASFATPHGTRHL
ncbi:MAG: hypothetical protein RIR62_335 [Pseudomonadota bacterium]